MKVGFTGTRRGITPEQRVAVFGLLVGVTEAHHGDCLGADAEFHEIITSLGGIKRVGHPPSDPKSRAWCQFDELLPEKDYLARNRDIVEATELLIACPGEDTEMHRSGTWSCVRYARKLSKPIRLVYPDGTVEGGPKQ